MTNRCALIFSTTFSMIWGACGDGARTLTLDEALGGPGRALVEQEFAQRRWQDALDTCALVLLASPDDCSARYCQLLARGMLFVDQLNDYLLPKYRAGSGAGIGDVVQLLGIAQQLEQMDKAAAEVTVRSCSYDLPVLPLRIGDAAEPLVLGEVRGRHTPREAYLLAAIAASFQYLIANLFGPQTVPPPPPGERVPELPAQLEKLRADLVAHDALLFSQPVNPTDPALPPIGGWWDRDGNGVPSEKDELLLDIFVPGSKQRVFDFSSVSFIRGEQLPRGALVPTDKLPEARCGYQRWHVATVLSGPDVGTADGMSFSPDGRQLALPIKVQGLYQIHLLSPDGSHQVCLTCAGATAANDGVRWRPRSPDTLLFVSNRDHPFAIGGSGGGAGQELYVMRPDGTAVTRLTHSPAYATNYHPNWSADGSHLVWGRTDQRTWDVMVAEFSEEPSGPRLRKVRRLARDTTWTETHGFSHDGRSVIVTNSRAGLLSADLYAIDLETAERTRLTDDPAWDEHGHLSPDGRKLAWMSGAGRLASMLRLNDGSLSPLFDFFWIAPGVFFEFLSPPSGYATELMLMDADGTHVQSLTADGLIVADNEWSPDSQRILFRQVPHQLEASGAIKLLTFDDCPP